MRLNQVEDIDADGDGKISKTELQMFYMMNGGSLSDEEVNAIFLKADVNDDGVSRAS